MGAHDGHRSRLKMEFLARPDSFPDHKLLELLLSEGAQNAKRVLADRQTVYPTIQDYFSSVDQLFMDKKAVLLHEDGTVTLDF